MKKEAILTGAGVALVLAACIVPPSMYEQASWGQPPDPWQRNGRYRQAPPEGGAPAPVQQATSAPAPVETSASPTQEAPPPAEPPLYSWDGGVVDGAPQGAVTAQGGTPRGLENPPAGRMHIIELYQQVLDERDALSEEVELLRKTLEETSLALEAKTKAAEQLSAQVAALEASHRSLLADNQAIAARLVQAQIRRLEAEKLLLETRIEVERQKAEEAARAAQAAKSAAGKSSKARSGEKPREPQGDGQEDHE